MSKTGGGKGTNQYRTRGHSPINPITITVPIIDFNQVKYKQRRQLAGNRYTDPVILRQLAADEDPSLMMALADNPNTPADVIDCLVDTTDINIWEKAIMHPHCAVETALRLVEEIERTDKQKAQQSPGYLPDASHRLRAALSHPDMPPQALHRVAMDALYHAYRPMIIHHPNCSDETLRQIPIKQGWYGYGNLASDINTPPIILERLVRDRNASVRRAVATNPNATAQVLTALISLNDNQILKDVLAHPNCPDHIRAISTLAGS